MLCVPSSQVRILKPRMTRVLTAEVDWSPGVRCLGTPVAVGRSLVLGCTPPLCAWRTPAPTQRQARSAEGRCGGWPAGCLGTGEACLVEGQRRMPITGVPCSYQAAFMPDAQTRSRGPGLCSCLCHMLLRPEGPEGGCVYHQAQGSPVQGAHDLFTSSEPLCV